MNLAFLSTVVDGTGGAGAPAGAAGEGAAAGGMNPIVMILLYCVIIFGVMYFFSIRPQKKRNAEMQKMRENIKIGDPVLLANGMFGKVVDITAECYVIEFGTNRGVRIPVIKQEVYAKKEPNLSNKPEEEPGPEKKPLFGSKKKDEENKKDDIAEEK